MPGQTRAVDSEGSGASEIVAYPAKSLWSRKQDSFCYVRNCLHHIQAPKL